MNLISCNVRNSGFGIVLCSLLVCGCSVNDVKLLERVTLSMGFIKFHKMLMFCSGAPAFEKL